MNSESAATNDRQIASLADEDAVKRILVGTVFGLWDIVNNLTIGVGESPGPGDPPLREHRGRGDRADP
jgi:hypothetical protein